ncbi:MarR family transcriptional regulator [Mycolicibacterium flavescens]|uniref:MarR family transcriptional regulator n=1 Tax=Mycolicibacterium flavescens TaxID=1776 RepID=A0A1E3RP74_MYCFV|nr:MarR family transcriptional regulator [Mycolicibacterium flavescens]ODQ91706.1 MarR family transcriptional regulator [Mycolicibacterium flavescens]
MRRLIAAERSVLQAHGVSMWGYSVLTALDESPVRTQAALAEAIGADKTRIIATLDELQAAGFIERHPDPADRRARLLAITDAGRELKDTAQAEIQRSEERWLSVLDPADRDVFFRALHEMTRVKDTP